MYQFRHMLGSGIAALIFSLCTFAQSDSKPAHSAAVTPVHIKGWVTDEDGGPIAQAKIAYLRPYKDVASGADGHFEFETTSPYFVIQKAGYASARVRASVVDLHVKLHQLPNGGLYRTCSPEELQEKAPGWSGIFQFPKQAVKSAENEKLNVDYLARAVTLQTGHRKLYLSQGRGRMWASGPSDQEVWESKEFQEATYVFGSLAVVDAKGRLSNGKCWRSLGVLNESMYYSDIDCAESRMLDHLFDQACLIPDAAKHLAF